MAAYGEITERARAEWAEKSARLDAEEAKCGWCKRAKAKGRRACSTHRMKSLVAYNTSPVSEAYWAS